MALLNPDGDALELSPAGEPDLADTNADWLKRAAPKAHELQAHVLDRIERRQRIEDAILQKHLSGQHDQRRHGWRYGSGVSLSRLRRQRRQADESEWEEYKRRVRGGTRRPTGAAAGGLQGKPAEELAGKPTRDGQNVEAQEWYDRGEREGASFSMEARGRTKDNIVRYLAGDTGIEYEDANDYIRQWANTSNDQSYASLETQQAAAELFESSKMSEWQKERQEKITADRNVQLDHDLPLAEGRTSSFFETETGAVKPSIKAAGYNSSIDANKALLRSMYSRTQSELADAGIRQLTLYRGMYLSAKKSNQLGLTPQNVGNTARIRGNALESWSTDPGTSSRFGNIVVEMTVPAERIVGSARTGFGCLSEFEYVLSSGAVDDVVRIRRVS